MSLRHAAFRAVLLATAAAVPLTVHAQSPLAQAGSSDVIRVLLDQSAYWRSKSETKLADEALARVLALDPNNVDALAQQAQAAADRGDVKAARDALARLQAARPDDPRIASIQQSLKIGPIDQAALADARRLAQEAKPNEALAAYRRVFKGDPPPPSLATEYYQTLGATEGNWEAARDGLATHLRADPQDLPAQLAYAEILTYRDETREDGVARLSFLTREAQVSAQADRAWRQALSWLPATQGSVPKYDQYLQHNPNDSEVQHWRAVAVADTGSLRALGFEDLQNNKFGDAESEFNQGAGDRRQRLRHADRLGPGPVQAEPSGRRARADPQGDRDRSYEGCAVPVHARHLRRREGRQRVCGRQWRVWLPWPQQRRRLRCDSGPENPWRVRPGCGADPAWGVRGGRDTAAPADGQPPECRQLPSARRYPGSGG